MKSSTNTLEIVKENKANNNSEQVLINDGRNEETLDTPNYGDVLFIIGRIWIEGLKMALVGAKFNVIPVVEAAKPAEAPKKPPPMKYKDLPLYECPHYEYKDYVGKTAKCPDANVKLLHRYLLPHIKQYRQKAGKCFCEVKCAVRTTCDETCSSIRRTKKQIKDTMRDPDNLLIRRAVVAAGGITGYLLGSGGGIPRRVFMTTLGFLSAGALCFPKETDDVFRDMTYYTGNVLLAIYNKWCNKGVVLRERLPCKDELPLPPPPRQGVKCPPK